MDKILTYTITSQEAGMQVLEFLRSKGFSRHILTSMKPDKEALLVNGVRAGGRSILKEGDFFRVRVMETATTEGIVPASLPLNILYEDEDILVLNKPSDMPVHPSIGNYTNTLANAAAFYFQERGEFCPFRCINRLDRDTSGLTIVSKHLVSGSILSDMTKYREVHREYLAIARGSVTPSEGTIQAPLGRKEGTIIERTVDWEHGEDAVTHYKVVKEANGHSLVSLRLETGRTHQIRIHMKYLGYPLIGDYLYNPDMEYMTRQALHSHHMEFTHPITGEHMSFTAPLPEDMARVMQE